LPDHVRLLRDLTLAAQGKPILSQPALGYGGSYNYGRMRIAAAYAHALLTRNAKLASDARSLWLDNEREQLTIGHHCHLNQCEQLEPQPHSEFIIAAGCLMWREALKQGDRELAAACEADMGRDIALWKVFNLGGIVCAPSARAKDAEDKSNDAGVGQWRNRPGDAILSRVLTGRRGVKFNGLSVQLFDECLRISQDGGWPTAGCRDRLESALLPKLRVPVHRASLSGGGYAAWYEPTEEAKQALGRDALSGVVHQIAGRPEVYYDWQEMPGVIKESGLDGVEAIGA